MCHYMQYADTHKAEYADGFVLCRKCLRIQPPPSDIRNLKHEMSSLVTLIIHTHTK